MTRKELATAVGGLVIGAGCSAQAGKLVLPVAGAAEAAAQARINRMQMNLNSKPVDFTDRTNQGSVGPSPNYGWTFEVADRNIVEAHYESHLQNDVVIKAKAPGSTTVKFHNPGYGTMVVYVNCR